MSPVREDNPTNSSALLANLKKFEVTIDEKYLVIKDVMAKYYGIMDAVDIFLEELSHPLKNWEFIVHEAKKISLDYFHLIKNHPKGHEAARRFVDTFMEAVLVENNINIKAEAFVNVLRFIEKIIKDSGDKIENFILVLDEAFNRIYNLDDELFFLFVKSYYPSPNKIAEIYLNYLSGIGNDFRAINLLMYRYLRHSYTYWLNEDDPREWFKREAAENGNGNLIGSIFNEISHNKIHEYQSRLYEIIPKAGLSNPPKNEKIFEIGNKNILSQMIELPGYAQIVKSYREIPEKLLKVGNSRGNRWKVIFLFHIMNLSGLSMIHEDALQDINRTLSWLIGNETPQYIRSLIEKTFSILKLQVERFPVTALNGVLNMGRGVYKTDNSDLVNHFIKHVVELGFQSPMIGGVDNNWKISVNPAHIHNIRTWLELIELNPKWSTRLLSGLIIHLSLSGIFIRDIDLFPRDITRLLNSEIAPVYNLVKQLARLFPVYFNDIGAEGLLRDISTQIDELTHRRDVLIHFLRKQSHVESSNRIMELMEATLNFWMTREKTVLKPFLPPNIFDQIETKGQYIDGVFRIMTGLKANSLQLPGSFLSTPSDYLKQMIDDISDVSDLDRERVRLISEFYNLLHQKYHLTMGFRSENEIRGYLSHLKTDGIPDINKIFDALKEEKVRHKISKLLDYLEHLKQIILSEQEYDICENIYKKRHFAVDIPSMYGKYHEMKFDALGLTFRIESLVNTLFEEMVNTIDLSLITRGTFYKIFSRLMIFKRALMLDGIVSNEIERQMDFLAHSLDIKGFTFTQYIDIFKGFAQAVKNIIHNFFHNIHEKNLSRILCRMPVDTILPKYLPTDKMDDLEKQKHRISEIFFRDRLAASLGLQQLDIFIGRILNTFYQQQEKLSKEKLHQLLFYDPEFAMISLDEWDRSMASVIYLGNKGHNLMQMKSFGLPVPPGFIITAEVFHCKDIFDHYPPAANNFKEQLKEQIRAVEEKSGKKFGDPSNPLLFSVRSGSSISQPGMMDTFLDVGVNEKIALGMASRTGNEWFAWDNYRRFVQCYGMAFGVTRDTFDEIMRKHKKLCKVRLKREFTGAQMKQLALKYKDCLKDSMIDLPEDPLDQLLTAIRMVFNSWESNKAKEYRRIMRISDDWGTAVTVQSMVYGNLSQNSGTGVFFTHNPRWPGDCLRLWGDFTVGNQGEDVVAGLVNTMPISSIQQEVERRNTDTVLEINFPEIYNSLKIWVHDLIYKQGWSPQEIEFTFESPGIKDLYLLQTRDMAMKERKDIWRFILDDAAEKNFLGHGIGVGGGAMAGRAVFSLEEIDRWRELEPSTFLILLRNDTVPDDIREIYAADGILTARGGLTSHAAVVAYRLGKTCVVNCGNLICNEPEKVCFFDGVQIKSGDYLSIDGLEGSVYYGNLSVKPEDNTVKKENEDETWN